MAKNKNRKFEWMPFIDDDGSTCIVFDAEKYHSEKAREIASVELDCDVGDVRTGKGYVYYGIGMDDDCGLRHGYWLTYSKTKNSFEAIVCTCK